MKSSTKAFVDTAERLGDLVASKNQAYGDSFAVCDQFLQLLYPDGIKPEQYSDMLLMTRVFDKMMRTANQKDAFGESPWTDIAGYGLCGMVKDTKGDENA